MPTKRKGKKTITVDFTGVSTEGGSRVLEEGPIRFEVDDVTEEMSQEDKPYLKMVLKVDEDGEYKGCKVYDNFSLQPQALWKLRGFMEAAGLETVEGKMEIDPDEFIGCLVVGNIVHEEYKGKTQNRVNEYSQVEDEAPKATEGETTRVKKKAAATTEDETEWKVKQKVSFKDGKKTLEGVITKIDGDEIDVKVDKDEYTVSPNDLTAL